LWLVSATGDRYDTGRGIWLNVACGKLGNYFLSRCDDVLSEIYAGCSYLKRVASRYGVLFETQALGDVIERQTCPLPEPRILIITK
jgi:hypothetical protein